VRALAQKENTAHFVASSCAIHRGRVCELRLNHRLWHSPRVFTYTEPRAEKAVRPRANPSLHPTCYGWLRQPPQAGELKR